MGNSREGKPTNNENPVNSAVTFDEIGRAEKILELETKRTEIQNLENELEQKKKELVEFMRNNQLLN